jgi:hypothetical protein
MSGEIARNSTAISGAVAGSQFIAVSGGARRCRR